MTLKWFRKWGLAAAVSFNLACVETVDSPANAPGAAGVSASVILTEIDQLWVQSASPPAAHLTGLPGGVAAPGPFFRVPAVAPEFEVDAQGGVTLVQSGEGEGSGAGTLATGIEVVFPPTLDAGVHVAPRGDADAWLRMAPTGPSSGSAERALVDGVVVYPQAVGEADALYVVDDHRVEAWYLLRSANDVAALQFDVALGPGLSGLRVDRTGRGLEAYDHTETTRLRSPGPLGQDADGRMVYGSLTADRPVPPATSWTVRVDVDTTDVQWPLLLDPSWVSMESPAALHNGGAWVQDSRGRLLAISGFATRLVEAWDPQTGSWSTVGEMPDASSSATATLLPDGQVLVVGGWDRDFVAALRRVDLLNPETGTVTSLADMREGRTMHRAVSLPDGDVWIVGGATEAGLLASSVRFNAATSRMEPGPSIRHPMSGLATTVLQDGRVLVGGGTLESLGRTALTDLYDPATNTIAPGPTLTEARRQPGWIRLPDGRVLVIGGICEGERACDTVEFVSAQATRVRSLPAPAAVAQAAAVVTPRGTVLTGGGVLRPDSSSSTNLATTREFDPATERWIDGEDLTSAMPLPAALLLPTGRSLFVGNVVSGTSQQTVLSEGTSNDEPVILTPRLDPVSGRLSAAHWIDRDGRVFFAGGVVRNGNLETGRRDVLAWDPESGSIETVGQMLHARRNPTATPLPSGEVVIIGGSDERWSVETNEFLSARENVLQIEHFDPITGRSTPGASLSVGRNGHSATLLADGRILIVGGTASRVGSESTRVAEIYDPRTRTIATAGFSMAPRFQSSTVLMPDGLVYITGGFPEFFDEVWDPSTGSFRVVGVPNPASRCHPALTSTGSVLVTCDNSPYTGLFNPSSGAASREVNISGFGLYAFAVTLVDGTVLVGYTRDVIRNGFTDASPVVVEPRAVTVRALPTFRQSRPSALETQRLLNGNVMLYAPDLDDAPLVIDVQNDDRDARPQMERIDGDFVAGGTLTITGTRLVDDGQSGASLLPIGAGTPVARLRRLDNNQVVYLRVTDPEGWRSTSDSLQVHLPAAFAEGRWGLELVRSGVSSETVVLRSPVGVECTRDAECGSGLCTDGVCCAQTCGECQACSVAAGGTVDGQCTQSSAGECRREYLALTVPGEPVTETFNGLSVSGTTGSTLPAGWYFEELGSAANATYGVGTGTSQIGNTWVLASTGSTDYALGGLQSGSLVPRWGVRVRNETSERLDRIALGWTNEQWRIGEADRDDRITLKYSLDAATLLDGVWTPLPGAEFVSPVRTGSARALDGNGAAQRGPGLAQFDIPGGLAPGAEIWFRWEDFNATGSDDILAVDDVSVVGFGTDPGELATATTSSELLVLPPFSPGDRFIVQYSLERPTDEFMPMIRPTLHVELDDALEPVRTRSFIGLTPGDWETIARDSDATSRTPTGLQVSAAILPPRSTLRIEVTVRVRQPIDASEASIRGFFRWTGEGGGEGFALAPSWVVPLLQCETDADCDEYIPCVDAGRCIANVCAVPTPRMCDDGNACTIDACVPSSNECGFVPNDALCNDGDPCTIDRCGVEACEVTPFVGPCDDGSACTEGDECTEDAGECVGTIVTCVDDGNPCTAEACDPEVGCGQVFVDGPCDDGDPCTRDDRCEAGVCGSTPLNCDDGNACTIDACDTAGTCNNTAVVCASERSCEAATGACVMPYCGACSTDADCDARSACAATSNETRCLTLCETSADCLPEQTCAEGRDGSMYCFDTDGACAPPGSETDPDAGTSADADSDADSDASVDPDAGSSDDTDSVGGEDGPGLDSGQDAEERNSGGGSGGCTTTEHPRPSSTTWWALVACSALWLRRRSARVKMTC